MIKMFKHRRILSIGPCLSIFFVVPLITFQRLLYPAAGLPSPNVQGFFAFRASTNLDMLCFPAAEHLASFGCQAAPAESAFSYAASPSDTASRRGVRSPLRRRF